MTAYIGLAFIKLAWWRRFTVTRRTIELDGNSLLCYTFILQWPRLKICFAFTLNFLSIEIDIGLTISKVTDQIL